MLFCGLHTHFTEDWKPISSGHCNHKPFHEFCLMWQCQVKGDDWRYYLVKRLYGKQQPWQRYDLSTMASIMHGENSTCIIQAAVGEDESIGLAVQYQIG